MRLERLLYTIPLRLRSLFRRGRLESELDEELNFHLEERMAQEMAAGKDAETARYEALKAMQGLEQQKEKCRDTRRMQAFENWGRNLRYSLRTLKQSPGFTVTTVLTLALGIGANSAIFSLVDTVMLKLLPVQQPDQLYLIGRDPHRARLSWNYPDYRAMRDHNKVFADLAGYSMGLEQIGVQRGNTGRAAELSYGVFVTGNYFDVLGVSPVVGRAFNTSDDRASGASPYVILSYSYWQSHFNGDSRAIGHKMNLNGYPFTVIGVAPRGFIGADIALKPDFFLPVMMRSQVKHIAFASWNDRHYWWLAALGRLKPRIGIKRAESELFAICKNQELAERRSLADPKLANTAERIVLEPAARGYSYLADQLKKPLLILFVIVALVLFIACANVANLMLARGAARQREIAVRLAMGASRWRVISELLTESMVIAVLGGLSGILVAFAGIRILLRFTPQVGYGRTAIDASIDWNVLAFTVAVCVCTGLVFGILPAWQSTRPDLVPALKDEAAAAGHFGRFTLRKGLVIVQIALSLPLLVSASLFVQTLGNLRELDTGFNQANVYIASVDPTSFGYKGQRTLEFYNRLCAWAAAAPGVRAASLALITPLTGSSWDGSVTVEDYTPKSAERNHIFFNAVGARFFEAMGTRVMVGREFTELDNPSTAIEMPDHLVPGTKLPEAPGRPVAIVNETFARHFFGERSAIGMHVAMGGPYQASRPYEIVGVVHDTKYFTMRGAAEPMMFVPVWRRFAQQTELVIRTAGPAPRLAADLRNEIHRLDPVIPLLNLRTLEHDVNESILVERLVATLSGFFSILAVLLSALGLYGVVAYTVLRGTREIGIRIAIGASGKSVLWLVVKDVVVMVVLGAIVGGLAAFLSTRAIASILYGVTATDAVSIVAAIFCLTAAALAASFLPARRAARIDPMTALRYE